MSLNDVRRRTGYFLIKKKLHFHTLMFNCDKYKRKILTGNVLEYTQGHTKSLKTMIAEVVEELVTVENICLMIPLNKII